MTMIKFCGYGPKDEDGDWVEELDFYDLMDDD